MSEERTLQQRLRYAASPDQNGRRLPYCELFHDAETEIARLSAALTAAEGKCAEYDQAMNALTDEYKISTHDASGDLLTLDDRICAFGAKLYLEHKTTLASRDAQLQEAKASIAVLREALKPFAEHAKLYDLQMAAPTDWAAQYVGGGITIGQVRKAREALRARAIGEGK